MLGLPSCSDWDARYTQHDKNMSVEDVLGRAQALGVQCLTAGCNGIYIEANMHKVSSWPPAAAAVSPLACDHSDRR